MLKYLKIKFSNAGNRISTERVVSGEEGPINEKVLGALHPPPCTPLGFSVSIFRVLWGLGSSWVSGESFS